MGLFRKKRDLRGAHVLVTGGSEGIGYAIAKEFAVLGADVTLVARTQRKLDAAKAELDALCKTGDLGGSVACISADVTHCGKTTEAMKQAAQQRGQIDYAVCAAGLAIPGSFLDQDVSFCEEAMQLNYFGTLYVAKAVLPAMVERHSGHLVIISSPLAIMGPGINALHDTPSPMSSRLFMRKIGDVTAGHLLTWAFHDIGLTGYSTYCPSKSAQRALADVLRNELAGTGVKVSVGYPLDTATPGLERENLTKPPDAAAITDFASGTIYQPDQIAKSIVKGVLNGEYHIRTPETLINILITAASGVAPRLYPLVVEMLLAPIAVVLQLVYGKILNRIVIKVRKRGASVGASGG